MSDSSNKLCIDLCSGLGGFSRAFVDAGWEVITVDIDPKFKPTICADVTKIDWEDFKNSVCHARPVDVYLASPPCNHFSMAGSANGWPRHGIQKALEIVGACFEGVVQLKPRWWLIENPRGRLRVIIGKPLQTIFYSDYDEKSPTQKPTDLWGNISLPMPKHIRRPYSGSNQNAAFHRRWGSSAKRALVPEGVSQAILEAVEST